MHPKQILEEIGITEERYNGLISSAYRSSFSCGVSSETQAVSVRVDIPDKKDKYQDTRLHFYFERLECPVSSSYYYRASKIELYSYGELIESVEQLNNVLQKNSNPCKTPTTKD